MIRLYRAVADPDDFGPIDSDVIEDTVSAHILKRFHGVLLETHKPVSISSDGNCMYRAVSLAMFNKQDYHVYLRIITAKELISHQESYSSTSASRHEPLFKLAIQTSPYNELLRSVLRIGEFAEMAHVFAIGAALGVIIQSYMPPGPAIDVIPNPYTCRVVGRGVRDTGTARITLMWTVTAAPDLATDFQPNHFVLLVEREHPNTPVSVPKTPQECNRCSEHFPQAYDHRTSKQVEDPCGEHTIPLIHVRASRPDGNLLSTDFEDLEKPHTIPSQEGFSQRSLTPER